MPAGRPPPEDAELKTKVEDLVALLGKPHMIKVLYVLDRVEDAPVRFSDIKKHVDISPTTLSERLKDAVDAGLLERTAYDENPPRVEYKPTSNIEALRPAFIALHEWCKVHELRPTGAAGAEDPAGAARPR